MSRKSKKGELSDFAPLVAVGYIVIAMNNVAKNGGDINKTIVSAIVVYMVAYVILGLVSKVFRSRNGGVK